MSTAWIRLAGIFSALLVSGLAPCQTVAGSFDGIDIVGSAFDSEHCTIRITLQNSGKRAATAFVIKLTTEYSDGTSWIAESYLDFFSSLGLEGLAMHPDSVGALTPGVARPATFGLKRPPADASIRAAHAELLAVVFDDTSVIGNSPKVDEIFRNRSDQAEELGRWCGHLDEIPKLETRRQVDEFISARAASQAAPLSPQQRTLREELSSILQLGMRAAVEYFNARCSTAPQHLRKEK